MLQDSSQFATAKTKLSLCIWLFLHLTLITSTSLGQHFAYITNMEPGDSAQNSMSIIDLATNTVVAAVPVGQYPQGVAINPAGTAAYVANTGDNSFTVIDIPSYTSTTIAGPGGGGATGVAVHPDGTRIYVTNPEWWVGGEGSTVWVIDRAAQTIVDQISCGKGSCGIAVRPDGAVAYVTNAFDGTIAVFDTDTHAVLDTIELQTVGENEVCFPVPLVVHPEGTFIYAANRQGPTFWAINTATYEMVALPLGQQHVCMGIHPNGTAVYVPNANGTTVDVIDTKTLDLITTVDGMNGPLGVAASPDGTRLYIVNSSSNAVSVLDGMTYAPITDVTAGTAPEAYGQFIGPGVPQMLKADAVARLQAVKETIEGGLEGVFSPQYAIDDLTAALDSGNLALQTNLWAALDSGEIDARRLVASDGQSVFEFEQAMVENVLDAILRGWIVNAELRAELLAIVDAAMRADRVLAAVAIDDAIVAEADPADIADAQEMLEQGDALVGEATVWQNVDKKNDLLASAVTYYEDAWSAAIALVE